MNYQDFSRLPELLVGMLADDVPTRTACGDEVASLFYGFSIHAELEEVQFPEPGKQQTAFAAAVRQTVNAPDFPKTIFVGELIRRLMGVAESWSARVHKDQQRFNKVADTIVAKMAATENADERSRYVRLLCKATCSGIKKDCKSPHEAFAMHHMALHFVFKQLGAELLADTDALWAMLRSKNNRHDALAALERIGPAAAPCFADHLLDAISASATAAVIAGNRDLIARLCETLVHGTPARQGEAILAAEFLGLEAVKFYPPLFDTVFKAMGSEDVGTRCAAVRAVAALGADRRDTAALIVGQFDAPGADEYLRGEAIMALRHLTRFPEIAVPALVRQLDAFKEYDPDWSYDGRHERVCHVLGKFGPAALPALPRLIAIIEGIDPHEDMQKDVIELVGSLGPAARDALPALMTLAGKYRLTDEDLADDSDPLCCAIASIKGTHNHC